MTNSCPAIFGNAVAAQGGLVFVCPKTWAGGNVHALSTVLAFEALGRGGMPRGLLFSIGAHLFGCAMAIANHGTAKQKARWGRQLASGQAVGALALTEVSGGSDMSASSTTITPV